MHTAKNISPGGGEEEAASLRILIYFFVSLLWVVFLAKSEFVPQNINITQWQVATLYSLSTRTKRSLIYLLLLLLSTHIRPVSMFDLYSEYIKNIL